MSKIKMKMYETPTHAKAKDLERLEKHYTEWFDTLGDETLYRIYDLDTEEFISGVGINGSVAMNRFSLAKVIATSLAEDNQNGTEIVQSWIVVVDKDILDFSNPVFIGSEDT